MDNNFIVVVSLCAGVVFGPDFVKHCCHMSAKVLLMRIVTSFQRYTGYLNFPIDLVLNSSLYSTTELSILLTSCLTAIESHFIKNVKKKRLWMNGRTIYFSLSKCR